MAGAKYDGAKTDSYSENFIGFDALESPQSTVAFLGHFLHFKTDFVVQLVAQSTGPQDFGSIRPFASICIHLHPFASICSVTFNRCLWFKGQLGSATTQYHRI